MAVGKVGDGYIEIHADADQADRELDHLARDRKAKIDVNLVVAGIAQRLAFLARDRNVWIRPILDNKALALVETGLLRLSGARFALDWAKKFKNLILNIDTLAPKVGGLAVVLVGLAGASLAAISNLSGIAYSLGQVVGAGVALPAMFLGAAATMGTLVTVLKDAKVQLKSLGPVFKDLAGQMRGAFWVQAEGPIRSLTGTLVPGLRVQLRSLSTELGATFAGVAGVLGTARSLGILNRAIESTAVSANVARDGFTRFTGGLLMLTNAGSKYLPVLGNWFTTLGTKFEKWATMMADTGKFDDWMKVALAQLKALGTVLTSTVGIFKAFAKAALAAGGSSLESLARGLKRVSDALNGTKGQEVLTNMFRSAHAAMAAMSPGLDALGRSLRDSIIPMFTKAMPAAGAALGAVFGTLATILANPVFTSGVTAMLEGATTALTALQDSAGPLASVLGAMARAFGIAMSQIGLLPAGLAPLAPALVAILDTVGKLIQVLAPGLIHALAAIGPSVSGAVTSLTGWIQVNPRLVAGIGVMLVGFRALVSNWGSVAKMLEKGGALLAKWPKHAMGLADALQMVAPKFLVFLKFAGIAGMLVSMYTASENFRRVVNSLAKSVGTVLASAFVVLGQILVAVGPLFTALSRLLGDVAAILLDKVAVAARVLAPIFSVAFLAIGAVVTAVVRVVTGLVQGLALLLEGDFTGAWAAVTGGVDGARGAFSKVIGPLTAFWSLAQKVVATVVAWVQTHKGLASAIGALQVASIVVTTVLKRMVTAAIASQVAGGAVNNLSTKFSALGSVLRKHPLFMIAGILIGLASAFAIAQAKGGDFGSVLGPIADKVKGFVSMVPGILAAVGAAIPGILSSLGAMLPQVISSVTGALSGLAEAVMGALPAMAAGFMSLVTGLGTMISTTLPKIIPAVLAFLTTTLPQVITTVAQTLAGMIGQFTAVIVAAIPQLSTTVVSLVNTLSQVLVTMIPVIVQTLAALIPAIVQVIVGAIQTIATVLPQILPPLLNGVITLINSLAAMLPTLIPMIITAGITLFTGLLTALIGMIPVLVTGLTTLINSVAAMLPTLIPLLFQPAIMLFTGLVQALTAILPVLIQALIGIITLVVNTLPTLIPVLLQAAIMLFMALVDALPQILGALIPAIIQVILAVVNLLPTLIPVLLQAAVTLFLALVQALPTIIAALIPAVIQVVMAVVRMLPTLIGALMNAAVQLFMALVKAVPQILGALLSAIGTLLSALFQAVMSADKQLMAAAGNLMNGLIQGLRNAAGAVRDAILNVIKGAVDAVKNFFGIHSPSTLMMTMGVNVDKGFIKGLESMIGDVEKVSGRLSAAASFDPTMGPLGTVQPPRQAPTAQSTLPAAPTTLALPSGGLDLTDASVMALAVALAKVLWPAARAAQIVEDLATNGPTRLAKGIS